MKELDNRDLAALLLNMKEAFEVLQQLAMQKLNLADELDERLAHAEDDIRQVRDILAKQ